MESERTARWGRNLSGGVMSQQNPPSLADVARVAGVSMATASRALNNAYGVKPSTREHVLAIAKELDYVASPEARGLARGNSTRVALVVPHIDRWFFGAMVNGIERILGEAGVDVLLYHVDGVEDRRRFFRELPARRKVEAVIVIGLPVDRDERQRLELIGAAIVAAGGQLGDYPSVCIDDRAAARQAVDHLVERGHSRIAMLAAEEPNLPGWPSIVGRSEGYFQALSAAGLPTDPRWIRQVAWGADAAATAMSEILDSGADLPTAVYAHSDELAIGAMSIAMRRGLRVPDDLAFVGIDDHPLSAALGLTTVRQDVRAQGEAAAKVVLQALGLPGGLAGPRLVLPTTLIKRSST